MRRRVPTQAPGLPKSFAASVDRVDSLSESDGDDASDSDRDVSTPVVKPLELPPKPVWNTASVLPQILGLRAACMDTMRARVCTATAVSNIGGRPQGGEISLWSMRTAELILKAPLPRDANGVQHPPRFLFFAPGIKSYIGLSGTAHLWAVSLASLETVGSVPAHDRQVLAAAFHTGRSEVALSFADGKLRVMMVSVETVRDLKRVRNVQQASFKVVCEWDAKSWCDVLAVSEGADAVLGAAEGTVYMWNMRTGARLSLFESVHKGRILSISSYEVQGEHRVCSADSHGDVLLWTARHDSGLRRLGDFSTGSSKVESVLFEPGRTGNGTRSARAGSLLTLAGTIPCIRSWDADTGLCTGEFLCYPPDFKVDPSRRIPSDILQRKTMVGAPQPGVGGAGGTYETLPHTANLCLQVNADGLALLLLRQGERARVFTLSASAAFLTSASKGIVALRSVPSPLPLSTRPPSLLPRRVGPVPIRATRPTPGRERAVPKRV